MGNQLSNIVVSLEDDVAQFVICHRFGVLQGKTSCLAFTLLPLCPCSSTGVWGRWVLMSEWILHPQPVALWWWQRLWWQQWWAVWWVMWPYKYCPASILKGVAQTPACAVLGSPAHGDHLQLTYLGWVCGIFRSQGWLLRIWGCVAYLPGKKSLETCYCLTCHCEVLWIPIESSSSVSVKWTMMVLLRHCLTCACMV